MSGGFREGEKFGTGGMHRMTATSRPHLDPGCRIPEKTFVGLKEDQKFHAEELNDMICVQVLEFQGRCL